MTEIHVTAGHIAKGTRKSACGCPLALAIKERFPSARVAVSEKGAIIDGLVHDLPAVALQFMNAYDRCGHGTPLPFSFQIS